MFMGQYYRVEVCGYQCYVRAYKNVKEVLNLINSLEDTVNFYVSVQHPLYYGERIELFRRINGVKSLGTSLDIPVAFEKYLNRR